MTEPMDEPWPARPWWSALWGAASGVMVAMLTDHSTRLPMALREVAPVFAFSLGLLGVLVMSRHGQRLWLSFALVAASWLAAVAASTLGYNHEHELFELPLLSAMLSASIAVPVFKTWRDSAGWTLPYARLYAHAWTDAAIAAAALVFVGAAFLLANLLSHLFELIGLFLPRDLLRENWFRWALAGVAFGASAGLLRERAMLVMTLQRLLLVVLAVLAPVLGLGLVTFLAALPVTGLARLWQATSNTTPLMLASAASAVVLANAVIGYADEPRGRMQRGAAWWLALCVLPLSIIAAVSLSQRIGQYGWTPDRCWAVLVTAVAGAYGLAYLVALVTGRGDWQAHVRRTNVALALGLALLAGMLATPLLDFGAIATRDQLARYIAGTVDDEHFDWRAFAFDFGPSGRAALEGLARNGSPAQRAAARATLDADSRWAPGIPVSAAAGERPSARVAERLRVLPAGTVADVALRQAIASAGYCSGAEVCFAWQLGAERFLVFEPSGTHIRHRRFMSAGPDGWRTDGDERYDPGTPAGEFGAEARLELRAVERRELFIDGAPSGVVVD